MVDEIVKVDVSFYKKVDPQKLKELIVELGNENNSINEEIDYYKKRYREDSCKEKVQALSNKFSSNTALMVVLSDLRSYILERNKGWQAMDLLNPNPNYGEVSPIPSVKKGVQNGKTNFCRNEVEL